jgi:membrane-associated protease RseP (regulator of RpoE activity)
MSDSTPPLSSTSELLPPLEVYVVTPTRKHLWINLLLLAATIFSTLLVGARLEYSFLHNLPIFPDNLLDLFPVPWIARYPSRLLLGIPFCSTLMLILLAHEMGHYLYCRYYDVYATLPYFIPAPTLIGTFGAFIRIKSPIRSRTALFDIGVAGPIAGFAVATVTLFAALTLSKPLMPGAAGSSLAFGRQLGYPLVFYFAHWLLAHLGLGRASAVPLDSLYLHPTAIAAWAGMFATALNLLPGGQLDGGHIVYAIFPRGHRWVSRLTTIGLVVASWWWVGWLLWALLLHLSGFRHPQVPAEPGLPAGRRAIFLLAIVLLALTFMYEPLPGAGMKEQLVSLLTR